MVQPSWIITTRHILFISGLHLSQDTEKEMNIGTRSLKYILNVLCIYNYPHRGLTYVINMDVNFIHTILNYF